MKWPIYLTPETEFDPEARIRSRHCYVCATDDSVWTHKRKFIEAHAAQVWRVRPNSITLRDGHQHYWLSLESHTERRAAHKVGGLEFSKMTFVDVACHKDMAYLMTRVRWHG